MKGVRWFQRFMLVILIGVNTFVYMTMKNYLMSDRIIYTLLFCGSGLVLFSIASHYRKLQKARKKSFIES